MNYKKNIHWLCFGFTILFCTNQTTSAQVVEQDSLALVALYDSTDGANWTNNENWLTGIVSTWFGITVLGDRVSKVELENNNLVGIIPAEIGNLTNLTELNLTNNQLTGEIPTEIGNLINLTRLKLSRNQLTGEILAEISNLTNLTLVYIFINQFTGEIPTEIGNLTNLSNIVFSNNQFTGEIPVEIGSLTNLTQLNLASNQLTGKIPTEIGNLTNMVQLYLQYNQLTGEIPAEISNLTNLDHLYLSNNQLNGEIPDAIGNLTNLENLKLHYNKFTGLPDLSAITTFIELTIQNNKFTFEDIEPNISVIGFNYSPQDSISEKLDTTISAGLSLTLSVEVGGTANVYQWTKDGSDISGATENTFTIDSVDVSDTGTYICEITNTIASELTLYSKEMNVTVEGAVGVEDTENKIPTEFALYQNYPNPFNPSTTIKYSIPKQSNVTIKVFDVLGSEVKTLVNKEQTQGNYEIEFDGTDLTSGIYFYRIQSGDFVETKKMILIK